MKKTDVILYNKCPNCDRRGIFSFGKLGGNIPPLLECKHCKKTYRVNVVLSILAKIIPAIFFGVIGFILKKYDIYIPSWLLIIAAILTILIFDRFAPFEEIHNRTEQKKE